MALTIDQVTQLAPDASSVRNAKKLAVASKWLSLGTDERALWGEIKGSGKKAYEVRVDMVHSMATKCTCSSRKLPCKHALGLMLLHAQGDVPTLTPPDWVQEWMEKRAARIASKDKPVDREAQAKRAAKRQENIVAGLDELELWLHDLLRGGFAVLPGKARGFYEKPAQRLVDAQAPALAERVKLLCRMPRAGGGSWVQDILTELGQLHLIIQGFRRFDALPEPLQADLRAEVGWAQQLNELADEPTVRDTWFVLGRWQSMQGDLRTQRLWLWGVESGRVALLLDFAYQNSTFTHNFAVGEAIDADVVFYTSAYPLRAVMRGHHGAATPPERLPGYMSLQESIGCYAEAIAQNPWLAQFPAAYTEVIPIHNEDGWHVVDAHGHALLLHPDFRAGWELFAVSGGEPVWLFGEWNGNTLLPLTVMQDDRLITL